MKNFALKTKDGRKCLTAIVAAGLAVVTGTQAQSTYNTEFTADGGFSPTFADGAFLAAFNGAGLSYSGIFPVNNANIVNLEAGTLSLTFSQPVTSISFDLGGMDVYWADQVMFPVAPTIGPAENGIDAYNQNPLTLSGTTINPSGDTSGGRLTFSDLPDVTYFAWTDTGTGSFDWTLYDNFSFTTSPVPEPSTEALAGLGCLSLIAYRRKVN